MVARQGLEGFDENTVNTHTVGRMTLICSECAALMFEGEKSRASFCCSHGSIKLLPIKEPPEMLKDLLKGNTKRDQCFRENIRAYNSSLAFASMCYTGQEFKFKNRGPYCFRISGQVYHSISQMVPEQGKMPNFSQIYIYDQENELDN